MGGSAARPQAACWTSISCLPLLYKEGMNSETSLVQLPGVPGPAWHSDTVIPLCRQEELQLREVQNLPKITQLVRGSAGIQTQVEGTLKSVLFSSQQPKPHPQGLFHPPNTHTHRWTWGHSQWVVLSSHSSSEHVSEAGSAPGTREPETGRALSKHPRGAGGIQVSAATGGRVSPPDLSCNRSEH